MLRSTFRICEFDRIKINWSISATTQLCLIFTLIVDEMRTKPKVDLSQFVKVVYGSMNSLQCLAYKPGDEIRKPRRSPASHMPTLAGLCGRRQGVADAFPGGEGRGTHPSSAFIELAGGCKAKDINASSTGKI